MYYLDGLEKDLVPVIGCVYKNEDPILISLLKTKKNKGSVKFITENSNKKQTLYSWSGYSRTSKTDLKFVSGKLVFVSNQQIEDSHDSYVTYANMIALSKVILLESIDTQIVRAGVRRMFSEQSPIPIQDSIMELIIDKIIEMKLLTKLEICGINNFPYKLAYYLDINSNEVSGLVLREMIVSYGTTQFTEAFGRAPQLKSLMYITDPLKFSQKTWPSVMTALGGKEAIEAMPEIAQKEIVYCYELFGAKAIDVIEKIRGMGMVLTFISFKELTVIAAKDKSFKFNVDKIVKFIKDINDSGMVRAFIGALEDAPFREVVEQSTSVKPILEELRKRFFENIKPGGEGIALVASELMMSQNRFEVYQEKYLEIMETLPFSPRTYPTVSGKLEGTDYSWESMDMGNPRGWFVGLETQCCQHLGSAGGSCVMFAAKNPKYSGIFRVMKNNKTVAQSFFWYHQDSGSFVFDNIEVLGGELRQSVIDSYNEYIEVLRSKKDLFGYKRVSFGIGYTDINYQAFPVVSNPSHLSQLENGGGVYSDAGSQRLMAEF